MNRLPNLRLVANSCAAISIALLLTSLSWSEEEAPGKLEFIASSSGDGLSMVTSVKTSPDGKFLYASAWQAATITVFRRDLKSGELTKIQEINDPANLQGATGVEISDDGKLALACTFRSKTAVLYSRDAESGELTLLDVARENDDGVIGLQWAVDSVFSPDAKFVYVIDSRGPTGVAGIRAGSVTVFRVSDAKQLEFVESGQDSVFSDARGIAVSPDGATLVVASSDAKTLVVMNRHADTGKTTIRQVIEDEQDGVHGLDGAMGVTISPDGRFVYVSSGRFRGDDAVGVYRFDDEGRLSLVQELINDTSDLTGFEGGNEITVSPEGSHVYAVASGSSALACFRRDTETGQLTLLETIPNEKGRLSAAAGLCVSPDGRFVYIAAEQSSTISAFKRRVAENNR